jgi:hypothetical protein
MIAVLSTASFPPAAWFSVVAKAETVRIEMHENFCKQSYRNRYEIYSANGKLPLTIPVVRNHGAKTPITQVKIDYSLPWQRIHLHAIRSAYGKTPFFIHYVDEVEANFSEGIPLLWDFNMRITEMSCRWLNLPVPLLTDGYAKTDSMLCDFRQTIHPKIKTGVDMKEYFQPFAFRHGFIPGLSVLDLIFNMGPEAAGWLREKK